jgi:hypothetical protein
MGELETELLAGLWGPWVSNSEGAPVRLVFLEMVKRAERLLNRLIFQFYETEMSHDDAAPFMRREYRTDQMRTCRGNLNYRCSFSFCFF